MDNCIILRISCNVLNLDITSTNTWLVLLYSVQVNSVHAVGYPQSACFTNNEIKIGGQFMYAMGVMMVDVKFVRVFLVFLIRMSFTI